MFPHNRLLSSYLKPFLSEHYRALDKHAYRVNYKIFGRICILFQFQCVSCTKNKIGITHLIFFHSVLSRDDLLSLLVYAYGKRRRTLKNCMIHCASASFINNNLVASLGCTSLRVTE